MDNEDPDDTRTMPGSNLVDEVLADASNDPRAARLTNKQLREKRALDTYNSIPNLHRAELETLCRALLNERDHLLDVVDAYEAGREVYDIAMAEGRRATPGQLWHKLLSAPEDGRLALLLAMLGSSDAAHDCFMQNHQGRIEAIEYELADVQAKLGSVFGFDTPQSLHSLTVAVQALRNIMVAGIAERGQVLTTMEETEMPEWRQPDGLEAEKAKVRDSLKEAGIDLRSVCGFEWPGDEMHEHACGEVNPLHAQSHWCERCNATLSHVEAEKLAEAGR